MDKTSLIGRNVKLGRDCQIGEYTSLGLSNGKKVLSIGSQASIRSHSVIYGGTIIGKKFQTGHGVLIREESKIGNNVSIGSHTVIEHHVVIRDNVRIHSNVFVPEYCVLQKNVWIGPSTVLTNSKYPQSKNAKKKLKGVIIKQGAKIGANVTILPGVKIGKNALIGAGSVVVKDVSSYEVVVGNPAKTINTTKNLPYV